MRRRMGEGPLKEGRKTAGLEVVRASYHDHLSRHAEETVDEYRWAEVVAPDSHDAACSPQGEDSMKVRGD